MIQEFFEIRASDAIGTLRFEFEHNNREVFSLKTTDPKRQQTSKPLSALGQSVARSLKVYFETGDWKALNRIPRASVGTTFQNRVWMECSKIVPGQIKTYSEIACGIAAPQAVRAVGRALGANPWILFVPCHRVVAKSGALRGYSARGGVTLKKKLLLHEGSGR